MRLSGSGRDVLTLTLIVVALALFGVDVGLGLAIRSGGVLDLLFPLLGFSFCLTGGLIAWKRRDNSIGWVILAAGLLLLLQALFQFFSIWTLENPTPFSDLADEAAWVQLWFWVPGFYLVALVLFLFPDGKAPTPRWSWVPWLVGAALVALLVAAAQVWPRRTVEWVGAEGLIGEISGSSLLEFIANSGLLILVIVSLAALVYRFAKAGRLIRQQLKWLVWAAASTWIASIVVASTSPVEPIDNPLYVGFLFLAVLSIPVSTTIAILRYRLYDIDRIISRTVTYALVVTFLGLVVLLLVAGMAQFLPSDDPLVVAVATLVVFALFNPVRLRVQRVVDRRFNRSRYDSARVIDRFAGSLQERVDPSGVVDDWVGVVEETMQPVSVGVWVKGGER